MSRLFNVPLLNLPAPDVLELFHRQLTQSGFHILLTLNPEMIVAADQNLEVKKCLQRAFASVADGIGIAIAGKIALKKSVRRVCGVDLCRHLFKSAQFSLYLVGAKPTILEKLLEQLKSEDAGGQVVGYHHGYFDEQHGENIIQDIITKRPDVVLVAMGIPLQERFLNRLADQLNYGIGIGVGGSFDVLSGSKPRAPIWLTAIGMEWAFRLAIEPQRIRRFNFIFPFIKKVWEERLSSR